ncbi:MAG: sigma-54 dependent transcriptional regulator [Proteobacteria bacterium]|nr:sigma-54 dependent transcriptional regulator [Pseudomonadota bacterium]
MKRVLLVDDDRRTRRVLQILLERLSLESQAFESAEDALEYLRGEKVELVLTDLKMPRVDGIEFMRRLRELDEEVPIVVLTAYGTVETAVEAMKLGAVDYLAKPFDVDALEILIRRSLELSRYRTENRYLREQVDRPAAFENIVGDSSPMRDVFELISKVAPTRSAVLITGETGTGKELVARAIHKLSPRSEKLFVPLNCTAIPRDLLESELFGHVRGAFSGAHADREGKFQAADGGTLFLDEIGDMEVALQAKLLRVIQEGVVEPVGSNRRILVDVRIVSSTHRDLESETREGGFREDLFYRLNVFRIELPPLRDRREDVPGLAVTFLREFGQEFGKGDLALGERAIALLKGYGWRGNVRELRNLMERAAVLADGDEIPESLVRSLLPGTAEPEPDGNLDLSLAVADVERRTILRALAATNDNKAEAATVLGIGERTLWSKLKKYGL